MDCVQLKGVDGLIRLVPLGKPYIKAPGEVEAGISRGCGEAVIVATPLKLVTTNDLIKEIDTQIGGGAGNWIKKLAGPVAKLVGKEGCSGCEVRRVTANAYAKLKAKYGQAEALKKIAELWAMSRDKELTLRTLKSYLDD